MKKKWSVYMLRCKDDSYYIGITKDFKKRMEKHISGKASKYTRSHKPVAVAYLVHGFTHSEALKLECSFKCFSHEAKENLEAIYLIRREIDDHSKHSN